MKNVADPSKLIFLMSDPVHDCKKAVTNLHSSGKSEKHTKFLQKGGELMLWEMFEYAYNADRENSGGELLAPKVTRDHIARSAFAGLKTQMSTQMMSKSNQRSVSAYHDQPVNQLLQMMDCMDSFIDIFNSGKYRRGFSGTKEYLAKPITSLEDERLTELVRIARWFEDWHAENEAAGGSAAEKQERFISRELFFDLRLCIYGFVGFVRHSLAKAGAEGIVPRLYNQDCVEGFFSLIR